ncbi:MAG: gluconate 2-dehydrogenase subunit 3 family protein, partial [Thermomicrobiales bacterium]
QIKLLRAACSRLIPTDDSGPGAEEAGVVYFIDREIGSMKYYRGARYTQGPYLPGEATQGDQSAMTMKDRFRVGLDSMDTYAKAQFSDTGFADLTADQQDKVLTDMQTGAVDTFGSISIDTSPLSPMATGGQPGISAAAFFGLLLSYTQAGFFSDPVHGGNRDMVGWKLIGFPGAHLSYSDDIENYNQPFTGDFISLGQYQQQVGGES